MCSTAMDITELKIFPSKREQSPIKAFCHATFNNTLVISGIKIMEGKKGVYVAFPFSRGSDGKSYPVVLPVNKEARRAISNRILATWVVNHCMDDYTV
jgi:stage V sporulation protein G